MLNVPFEFRLKKIFFFVLFFVYSASTVHCKLQDDIDRGISRFLGGGLLSLGLGFVDDHLAKRIRENALEKNSNLKKNNDENKVYLKDVIGQDEAVAEVRDILDFLSGSEKFKSLGASMPKGILLEGPPGTGKTLIAKALANESGFNFFYKSASSFVELYVGMGAKNVRDLFNEARKNKPAIIFIDEIDAIAGINRGFGGDSEYRQTLNELLAQLDGFESDGSVFVLAATNNASILDDAVKRPGRFTRIVKVDLPDEKGRQDLLQYYINKLPKSECDSDIINELAWETEGSSGADLQNLVNEAAIYAAKQNSENIAAEHLNFALEKIAKRNVIY